MPLLTVILWGYAAWAAAAAPETPFLNRQEPEGASASAEARSAPAADLQAYERLLSQGHALYFKGDYAQAVDRYESAIRISSRTLDAWVNGGAVLDEYGEPEKAAFWYEHAAGLDSADNEVLTALGWSLLRARKPREAAAEFRRVLQRDPDQASALLGLARSELSSGRPRQAVTLLTRATAYQPLTGISNMFLGQAYEAAGENANAVSAYRQAIGTDSYLLEARQALGRLYLRMRSLNDAFKQFSRILESEPHNAEVLSLLAKLQPLLPRKEGPQPGRGLRPPIAAVAASAAFPAAVPVLRIGIGTTPMGHPRARQALAFSATSDFTLSEAQTGKRMTSGGADEFWTVRIKIVKKRPILELTNESRRLRLLRRGGLLITPQDPDRGLVALNLNGTTSGSAVTADKLLRGQVEISLWKRKLRVINRLDLENYTHGVVSAEMPVRSPAEALKAQAVVARTHALFIKLVTRRHRKEGFDVCDEQHCQVYSGARAESERSRAVVEASRGVIVTYKGKPAHVIYSSNCAGHTQNGKDLTGWGDVPYWIGIADSPAASAPPASPWGLRRWVTSLPPAYCKPSNFVHPSHFRWTRMVSLLELSRKADRRYHTGRLKRIRPLRRSPSGNVNVLLLEGSKRRVKLDSEMAIRGLLAVGSLRSTLFVFEPEYQADGKPAAITFHGGGWGHSVGMCQSGAMGQAEAGRDFKTIILSYFPGTALGRTEYAPETPTDTAD
ncbi:MAG: SpoIID/LytB domain-containing protein [Elusimicrobiota bacterium]|jgi:SpoIID/LytB domain protein